MDLRRGSELILLVESNYEVKSLARDMLQRFGYYVLTAESWREAVDLYGQKRVDFSIVLLDMLKLKLNDSAVFSKVREINPEAKIIISSEIGHGGAVHDMHGRDVAGFLRKPYRMTDLLKMVEKVLDGDATSA